MRWFDASIPIRHSGSVRFPVGPRSDVVCGAGVQITMWLEFPGRSAGRTPRENIALSSDIGFGNKMTIDSTGICRQFMKEISHRACNICAVSERVGERVRMGVGGGGGGGGGGGDKTTTSNPNLNTYGANRYGTCYSLQPWLYLYPFATPLTLVLNRPL